MTRSELKRYILTSLGSPVINIEVESSQLEICIDDTLQLFLENHYDGSDHTYLALTTTNSTQQVYTLPQTTQEVIKVLNIRNNVTIFDEPLLLAPVYGMGVTSNISNVSYANIEVIRHFQKTAETIYNNEILFDFNTTTKKLFFQTPLKEVGLYFLEVYLSEESYDNYYNNRWVKQYATALAKRQWGTNLGKISGAQLPGGMTINFERIITEAQTDIDKLLEQLRSMYSFSPSIFIG
jgi:quinol monooxygenase YgiN